MNRESLVGWFAGRIPDGWFTAAPEVTVDRDEILVVGELATPALAADASEETVAAALRSRIEAFREESRAARMRIAREAENNFGKKVSWGARAGDQRRMFTTASVPVMTRLRLDERQVLDTLIESGVARSRSEALAWCVRLVGDKQAEWLGELRDALVQVERVRSGGPQPS